MKTATPTPHHQSINYLGISFSLSLLEHLIKEDIHGFLALFPDDEWRNTFTGKIAFSGAGVLAMFWKGENMEECCYTIPWPKLIEYLSKRP